MTDQNDDRIDEVFRAAIAERVKATREPRPFNVLPAQSEPLQPIGGSAMNNQTRQRGLLIGALALMVVVAGGIGFAASRNGGGTSEAAGEPELSSTTAPLELSDDPSTTVDPFPVTTEAASAGISPEDLGPAQVQVSCKDGSSTVVEVSDDYQERIEELINERQDCVNQGGLLGIAYVSCPESPFVNTVPANPNGSIVDSVTFWDCEFITGEPGNPPTTIAVESPDSGSSGGPAPEDTPLTTGTLTPDPTELTPTEPKPTEPEPTIVTTIPSTSVSTTSTTTTTSPNTTPASTPDVDTSGLVGETLEDARAIANARGLTIRVMRLDGQDQIGTMDYRLNRVNVEVTNGVVVKILGIG